VDEAISEINGRFLGVTLHLRRTASLAEAGLLKISVRASDMKLFE
jgi:hypothetical protein